MKITLGEVVSIYEKDIPTYGKLQNSSCHCFIFDLVIFILCFIYVIHELFSLFAYIFWSNGYL